MKYRVKGYAFVPVQIEVEVESGNARYATMLAQQTFDNANRKREFIVANSQDYDAVFDFEPGDAEEVAK